MLADPPHELLAAPRDDQIDEIGELEQPGHGLAVGRVDELDGVRRPARLLQGLGQDGRDHRIRLERLAAAAQHYRVARLHAETGGVGGDVGPGLVDEADDAERHPDAADLEAVGTAPRLDHGADRVGQGRDLAQAGGHLVDSRIRQREAIEKRARDTLDRKSTRLNSSHTVISYAVFCLKKKKKKKKKNITAHTK